MNSRILIIYEYQILYQILNEISESLNFEITQSNSKDLKELKYDPKNNYLIISKKKIEGIKNSLVLENVPIKFEKLIEIINIKFLKNKFLDQSHIKIGKYNSDSSLIYDSKGFLNKILILPSYSLSNFSKTAFFSLMSFGVCIAFLLKSLRNGFKALPNIDKPLLCMPIIRGVSNESDMVSKTRGIKYSSDDRFIYGDEINIGDVIHVFDHWKFNKNIM